MVATELKIGNYVYRRGEDGLRQITSIDCSSGTYSGVYLNGSLGRTLLGEIEPVELTKDHMDKFGFFELDDNLFRNELFPFSLFYVDDVEEPSPYWLVKFGTSTFKIKLMYVHELQNIVYPFTTMELNLN